MRDELRRVVEELERVESVAMEQPPRLPRSHLCTVLVLSLAMSKHWLHRQHNEMHWRCEYPRTPYAFVTAGRHQPFRNYAYLKRDPVVPCGRARSQV
jgi:hypothetical protein